MKRLIITGLCLFVLTMVGCNNSTTTSGSDGTVVVYSGGSIMATFEADGKITTYAEMNGWKFVDKATGDLIRVSGTVVIRSQGE